MTEKQQQQAAAKLSEEWLGKGYEKGESQPFWMHYYIMSMELNMQRNTYRLRIRLSCQILALLMGI